MLLRLLQFWHVEILCATFQHVTAMSMVPKTSSVMSKLDSVHATRTLVDVPVTSARLASGGFPSAELASVTAMLTLVTPSLVCALTVRILLLVINVKGKESSHFQPAIVGK